MGMTYPVHPDDIKALLKIRRYLIGFRITNGWTQRELSEKVNGTEGIVHDLEANQSWGWRLRRLQDWCSPFGLRLEATLRIGTTIDLRIHADPEVGHLYAMSRSDNGDTWKMFQSAYLTAGLRAARRAKRITATQMGMSFGCTASAIRNWERDANTIMLPKALHYARTLGGHVELGLKENGHGQD
jgi:hypothetical protein